MITIFFRKFFEEYGDFLGVIFVISIIFIPIGIGIFSSDKISIEKKK